MQLSYRGTSSFISCWQKSVCCVVSHFAIWLLQWRNCLQNLSPRIFFQRGKQDNHSETNSAAVISISGRIHSRNLFSVRPIVIFQPVYGYPGAFLLGVFFPNETYVYISHLSHSCYIRSQPLILLYRTTLIMFGEQQVQISPVTLLWLFYKC